MNSITIKILPFCWLLASTLALATTYSNTLNAEVTCESFFSYKQYEGNLPVTGGITFSNEATGDYTNLSWDFGDGNFSGISTDTLDHFYTSDGIYSVCLTIWDDLGCISTFCSDVIVGNVNDICNLTDCVFPGDANLDGEANFYDLLNLGIAQGTIGPERPNATIEWIGQIAPDWIQVSSNGVNYKHFDCDGNGVIDEQDVLAINGNYVTMDQPNPTAEIGAPLIHIEFDQDTIYVNDNTTSGPGVEVIAHLKIGTQEFPAQDIYGLALYLSYPDDLVTEDSVDFDYDNNSFFGPANEVLWVPNDQYNESQIDIGITRKDGVSVGGFGEIGKGIFVINSDILDGRIDDGDVHFPIHINGVRMVDSLGNELDINLTTEPTTLVFTKDESTGTNNPELASFINVSPNPASEKVLVDLFDIKGESLEIFNNFGQSLLHEMINDNQFEVNTKAWNAGVYFIKVQTNKGVVSKRLVLK